MGNVSSYFLFILFIGLFSCKENKLVNSKYSIENICNSTLTIVNDHSDSAFYKKWVYTTDSSYYTDSNGNLIFLITSKIISLGTDFGIANAENINKSIQHYRDNFMYINDGAYFLYTISILKKNKIFEAIWQWENPITIDEYGFGIIDLRVSLDASYSNFNNVPQSIIHLQFKTQDYDNGYKSYTLNYVYENKNWKLLYREKINTNRNGREEEVGYCIDTVNYNCQKQGTFFNLTFDDVVQLDDRICY
jgi:hypothetical protein